MAALSPQPPAAKQRPVDTWLCPLENTGARRGILPMPLEDYLAILDFTGRALRHDKRGAIPSALAPILIRLQLDAKNWNQTVSSYGTIFCRAAGRLDSLAQAAKDAGRRWLKGRRASRHVFLPLPA